MKHAAIASIVFLCACASTAEITDLGGGRFIVSKSAMTGASGVGPIRAEATAGDRRMQESAQNSAG